MHSVRVPGVLRAVPVQGGALNGYASISRRVTRKRKGEGRRVERRKERTKKEKAQKNS